LAMQDKIKIGKIYIDNVTSQECLNRISETIVKNEKMFIVTSNVDHIVSIEHDYEFEKVYHFADLVVADGMPLIWLSRILKTPLKERITGSDLFPVMCDLANEKSFKVFFMGGKEGIAERAATNLKKAYPDLQLTGIYSPPMNFEHDAQENLRIIEMINESRPNILFVSAGSPKQEKWFYKNIDKLNINIAIGVGAAFDFVAGSLKRAPLIFQNNGMEWFWRFLHEPKRLFKRYFIHDTRFILIIFKQIINKNKRS
jgi:N-acetylglucosaminyldiphosphoundecaprenol N-acetyl-beta-D-mannosaminyltransferase